MAVFKVIRNQPEYVGKQGKYHDDQAIETVVSYVLNYEKTRNFFIGGYGVNVNYAAYEMKRLEAAYDKGYGPRLRHMVLSVNHEEEKYLGKNRYEVYRQLDFIAQCAIAYYGEEYQIIYAVHENTEYAHVHMVMSTVNYRTGLKYPGKKKDYYDFRNYLNWLLSERYGLFVMAMTDQDGNPLGDEECSLINKGTYR